MSVQTGLLKTDNRLDALIVALVSLLFAVIAIAITVAIFNIADFNIDGNELIQAAIFDVFVIDGELNRESLALILFYSAPLALTGLAVAISFKAGLFNIGGQGQMAVGGCFAGIWAAEIMPNASYLSFLDTPILMIPSTLLAAFVGGALWGFVPGFLKAKTGAHEVIVTILMNIIAASFVTYLVGSQTFSPFVDKTNTNSCCKTDVITDSARFSLLIPSISNFLHWTFFIGIIAVLLIQLMVVKSKFGFRLRAVGSNRVAAEAAGINTDMVTILAMTISGGLAGLAGAYFVMGFAPYRYTIGVGGSMGFDGIAVALIGQNAPYGVGIAALLFGFLRQSKNVLGSSPNTDIPPDLIFAFQAWIILFAAAPIIATSLIKRSRKSYDDLFHQTDGEDK